jgi:hypothetical protein
LKAIGAATSLRFPETAIGTKIDQSNMTADSQIRIYQPPAALISSVLIRLDPRGYLIVETA